MVQLIDSTLFSPSAGRIVSAAGHNSHALWGAIHKIHYTIPGTGATLLPVSQEPRIYEDMKEPRLEDFLDEDEYEEAVDAYEAAVYEAEERAMEKYYENRSKSKKR